MDSERIDWISQHGVGVRKKKGIFDFFITAYRKRAERKVRDVNDLDAGISIRRYNLAFGIDSDVAGAASRVIGLSAVKEIETPVEVPIEVPVEVPFEMPAEPETEEPVDFVPSESENRTGIDMVYSYTTLRRVRSAGRPRRIP